MNYLLLWIIKGLSVISDEPKAHWRKWNTYCCSDRHYSIRRYSFFFSQLALLAIIKHKRVTYERYSKHPPFLLKWGIKICGAANCLHCKEWDDFFWKSELFRGRKLKALKLLLPSEKSIIKDKVEVTRLTLWKYTRLGFPSKNCPIAVVSSSLPLSSLPLLGNSALVPWHETISVMLAQVSVNGVCQLHGLQKHTLRNKWGFCVCVFVLFVLCVIFNWLRFQFGLY